MKIRRLFFLLTLLALAGCVGVASRQDRVLTLTEPTLLPQRRDIDNYNDDGNAKTGTPYVPYTQAQVLQMWGPPDSRKPFPDGHELWTYSHDLSWHGYTLFAVVVPIPLMAPWGTLKMYLDFDGQTLKSIRYEDYHMVSHGCWVVVPLCFSE